MLSFLRTAGISLLALLALACTPSEQQQQPNALIVDLNAVAKALGRDDIMTRQVQATRERLNQELVSISRELNARLEEKQNEAGDKSDEEDAALLEEFTLQARQTLEQSRELARQQILAYRSTLVAEFRDEVRTKSAAIARERGAATVLLADAATLWFAPDADITDEVIALMRADQQGSGEAGAGTDGKASGPDATTGQSSRSDGQPEPQTPSD